MNLDDYVIECFTYNGPGVFNYVYAPTGEVLLTTKHVSATTLLRIATQDNLTRKK